MCQLLVYLRSEPQLGFDSIYYFMRFVFFNLVRVKLE